MEIFLNLEEKNEYWSETFDGLDFTNAEIDSKEFDGCTFNKCNFSDAIFKRCKIVDSQFINCNLSLVKIEYSQFSDVSFRESKLIGINWTKADWPTFVFGARIMFYKCIVNDSSFYGLALEGMALEECKAHNVDFREGDFGNANFTYSDFSGSYFGNTNLSGTDFSEATDYDIDIYQNNIKHAKFSRFEAVRLLDALEVELVD
jgi:fluoroquinolone resistance protein